MILENIPQPLKQHGLWCVWKREQRDGEFTKVPYNVLTGGKAQPNNKKTFTTYDNAVIALPNYDGLGLGCFRGVCAIDIDDCFTFERPSAMANDIISTMKCYAERSPSGKGIRILFYLRNYKYDSEIYYIKNSKKKLEIYAAGSTYRFVTVTGDKISDYEFGCGDDGLPLVLEKYMKRPVFKPIEKKPLPDNDIDYLEYGLRTNNILRDLWYGSAPGYGSNENELDYALCKSLAYWCRYDKSRIIDAFLSSPYVKSKDQAHIKKLNRHDYLSRTVDRALSKT